MKAYTDLEQSKKLAEILSLESADMHYARAYFEGKKSDWFIGLGKPIKSDDIIPCWSLAALLSVIPEVSLNTFKDGKWNAMIQHDGKMIYEDKDNPIDACYELITRLNELKML